MTGELVERLRVELDRLEAIATAAPADLNRYSWSFPVGWIGADEERNYEAACAWRDAFGPAHVLRTLRAHRKIIDRHAGTHYCVTGDTDDWPHDGSTACPDIRALGSIYFPEGTEPDG